MHTDLLDASRKLEARRGEEQHRANIAKLDTVVNAIIDKDFQATVEIQGNANAVVKLTKGAQLPKTSHR